MSDDFTADPFFAGGESPDADDPYVLAQRKKARMRLVIGLVAVLLVVGGVFFTIGQKKAAQDALRAKTELLMGTGAYKDLREASQLASAAAAADDLAPAVFYIQGMKADLALWSLYTGSQSLTSKAQQMLDAAKVRGPDEPITALGEVLLEAMRGDPAQALEMLEGGNLGPKGTWHSIARAEALLRTGDLQGARAALGTCAAGLCTTWMTRIAMNIGDWEAAKAAADSVVQARAGHELGRTAQILATARSLEPADRIERLQGYMEETDLPPLLMARVVVALSRALRRAEGPKRADELLERALESSPDATRLAREVARTKRYQGYFGAAWTRADKALRNRPTDSGLLTELSAALFFNDAAELLEGRLAPAKKQGSGDGVQRAEAIAALVRGLNDQAIEGLKATAHLGEPGDVDLYLAEANLRAKNYDAAAVAAQRAHGALAATFGHTSREAAIAKMYEGVAVGMGGDADAAKEILEAAYVKDVRTVWGAWLYGRYHESAGNNRDAKDAYLLACHNGQDFAQACLALADIYDTLEMDGVMRRTQEQARKQYLRQSPKGWQAQRVKSALGK
ncbi:MAG: hypothetical protein KDA24_09045 [Deltaproteobacteria bacterium]|nr:hypothetical protein [Deltaproteobacteria bacterium]